jgi:hypothetical protein
LWPAPWIVPSPITRIWGLRKGATRPGSVTQESRLSVISAQEEIGISESKTITEAARELGVSEQTYERWRKEYGGREADQVRRLKKLEQENGRLKRLVADQALDYAILQEVSRGIWSKHSLKAILASHVENAASPLNFPRFMKADKNVL